MRKSFFLFASIFMIAAFALSHPAFALEAGDVEIHGFLSQGYLITDKNNYLADTEDGTFEFNEMGINFSADLTDMLHVGLQFFARDLGSVGNDEIVLDWAFGDYRWRDWLGFRAGKINIDYGLYNETREMDMLRTGVMLPQSVYPEVWRDSFSGIKGVALYGYVPLSVMGRFSYDLQLGDMSFKEGEGFSRSFAPKLDDTMSINNMGADYAWFASLQWHTPLSGLKTKFTSYDIQGLKAEGELSMTTKEGETISSPATFEFSEKNGYVLSLEYIWKDMVLSAEYAEDKFFAKMDISELEGPEGHEPPEMTSEGWYVSASYRFTDWLETGLSYSEYYPNANDKDGERMGEWGDRFTSWLKTTTLSTRFDINEYWVLKLEGSYNDGFGGMNLADNPDGLDPYWQLFAAKMTFSF